MLSQVRRRRIVFLPGTAAILAAFFLTANSSSTRWWRERPARCRRSQEETLSSEYRHAESGRAWAPALRGRPTPRLQSQEALGGFKLPFSAKLLELVLVLEVRNFEHFSRLAFHPIPNLCPTMKPRNKRGDFLVD